MPSDTSRDVMPIADGPARPADTPPAAAAIAGTRLRQISLVRRIADRSEVGAAIGFLTVRGINSYLDVATQVGIVGTTVTLLLIAGEFDLSIGSMVGFSGMIIALGVTQAGWPLWLALLVALLFSLGYGWAVGMLVIRTGIASFAPSRIGPISAASRPR